MTGLSDLQWEHLSNYAIATAGVFYFLALLAHLVQWSALRTVPVAAATPVAAGVPASGGADPAGGSVTGETGAAGSAATDDDTSYRVEMFGRLALLITYFAVAAHFV